MRVLFNLAVAAVLFLVGAGFSIKRAVFLMGAERTAGVVQQLHASNGTCGSKNSKYDCTKYSGDVRFTAKSGGEGFLSVEAGQARGYNQPVSRASRQPGSQVPVVYSPKDLKNAFHDTFFNLWGAPLGTFMFSGFFLVGAVSRRRRY